MGAHRRRSIAAWFLAALGGGLLASSCIIAPEDVTGPCKTDVDCPDDGIPCTKEVCGPNGFCERKAQDLPFGDKRCDDSNPCTDDLCQNGACAHQTATAPPSDGNECTDDACVDGVAKHTPLPDDTKCGLGDMLVCTGGKCNCQTAAECGTSTECLKFACTDNACASTSLEQGTLVDNMDPGDCLKRVCDGANNVVTVPDVNDPPPDILGDCKQKACDADGNVTDTNDDTDKPADDGNVCTTEACNAGVPTDHTPVADGTMCGAAGSCGPAAGGGYELVPHDVCSAGVCTPQMHTSCGLYKCNAGNTACAVTCAGAADCIQGTFCDGATNACKVLADAGNPCQNAGQCSSGFCVDGLCCNSACDGFCERCNDAGSPGLCIATQSGQDPDNECPGGDACNGQGTCAKQQGATCALDLDCLSGVCEDATCCDLTCSGACNRCDLAGNMGVCSPVDLNMQVTGCTGSQVCDGAGNCKTTNGQSCGGNSDCLSGFCQDGYCCNSSCGGNCARCDIAGKEGICTNVASGGQVSGCNTNFACDGSNNCKRLNGQTCNATGDCLSNNCPSEGGGQKYCCDTACAGLCMSCAGTKTVGAINGVCDLIKDKTDPDMECAGSCMGNGNGCCVFSGGMNVCQ